MTTNDAPSTPWLRHFAQDDDERRAFDYAQDDDERRAFDYAQDDDEGRAFDSTQDDRKTNM